MMRLQFAVLFFIAISTLVNNAQESDSTIQKQDTIKKASKELPLKPGRIFHLQTNEGTWMSLDVSPDGRQIAFDMLGDIYFVPIEGGKAKKIIGDLSFESHPKFSPDGETLVVTSDRSGSEINLSSPIGPVPLDGRTGPTGLL